jgi:adenosylhomocysteine nucleosidase
MQVEVETLVASLENKSCRTVAGSDYYEGTLEGLPVVVVQCGIGKVNASLCAQILCSEFAVTHLVNTGVAGSLDPTLDIGDLLVSRDAVHHDFDCGPVGYPPCQVPGMNVRDFPADPMLMELAFSAAESVNPGHTKVGRVASGDQFISRKDVKERIIANTAASCTEMEGAAIAHVAYRNGVPYVILRAISDKADDSAEMDYPTFEAIAARRCAAVTTELAKMLCK